MNRDFTNMPRGEQIVAIYDQGEQASKERKDIIARLDRQNGKVDRNCKDVHTIKIVLVCAGIVLSILLGLGLPNIPIL